jgi:hypothetical protein
MRWHPGGVELGGISGISGVQVWNRSIVNDGDTADLNAKTGASRTGDRTAKEGQRNSLSADCADSADFQFKISKSLVQNIPALFLRGHQFRFQAEAVS